MRWPAAAPLTDPFSLSFPPSPLSFGLGVGLRVLAPKKKVKPHMRQHRRRIVERTRPLLLHVLSLGKLGEKA